MKETRSGVLFDYVKLMLYLQNYQKFEAGNKTKQS